MKFKKILTAFLSAALAAGSVLSGTGLSFAPESDDAVSAAVSMPAAGRTLSESAYVTWQAVGGADGYNVYIKPEGGSYTQLDSMLIRQYSGYFRADAVGLKAGKYIMKVVPTTGGKEDSSKAMESSAITVTAHDRSGFGWVNGTSSGAYNEDGTLKSNAIVVYVTNKNKDTVKAMINAEGKGEVECVGMQNIILGYKKKKETRPLCMRIIGNITDPSVLTKGDLYIDTAVAGMTIEGIGSDATFNGFGLVMKNASNVEVRNIGFMNCDSDEGDDCGLQQSNDHVWVHNCDFFYGGAGSDADQVKGDGALDTKKSTYVTHSYNHFWDNGKCNLQGMKDETTENYVTYHHNWYDHSDSRHPRIRTCSVHIYNNYYDGNAKYGVGMTMGGSAFVENNYFRNCKYPMLTSMQGTDVAAGNQPTFSGEAGGVIKSFGNYMTGHKAYVTYQQNNTEFDAYEASSRSEKVPSSVKAKSGGTTYNNFDTASFMYKYTPDAAADVPAKVTAAAGRVDGGDLKFTFNNSVDDESYAINSALKSALTSYKDSIVAVGSGFTSGGTQPTTAPTTAPTSAAATTTTVTTKAPSTTTPIGTATVTGDVIFCSPDGEGKGTQDDPMSVTEAITKVQPGGAVYLLAGTYKFDKTILIDNKNNGSEGKYKTIMAYSGKVVWDFSQMSVSGSNRGVVLDGSYWWFKNFEITKAGDNGMLLSGSNNRLDLMQFNDNQDTGLQISRYRTDAASISEWPSNNLIINCTAKNNCDDATMENADGFAAKLTCGTGNIFDGCMSYNNSDDGWDLFAKTDTGPIGAVTIRNCIAFRNGYTEFGEGFGDCDGNGFKLGGSGVGSPHVVENCLAFENLNCGFTDNNNPKLEKLVNCSSYNNGVGGNGKPNISCYRCTDDGCDFSKIISYINTDRLNKFCSANSNLTAKASNDKFEGTIEKSIYYNDGYYYVDGKTAIANNQKVGTKGTYLTESDFVSLDVPAYSTSSPYDFHQGWRKSDGTINTNGFMVLKSTSKYAGLGADTDKGGTSSPINPGGTNPVTGVTTTTSAGGTTTTAVSTQPTTAKTTQSAGNHIHDFTANGTNSTYYTIAGNLSSSKGTVDYNGKKLTQCLKMESSTSVGFNAANGGLLTLVFIEHEATVKVDGTKYTASNGIVTVELKAGSHTITKADTANLYYISYAETAAPTPGEIIPGDINGDKKVNIYDAALLRRYLMPSTNIVFEGASPYDTNGDGKVEVADLVLLQKFILGMDVQLKVYGK